MTVSCFICYHVFDIMLSFLFDFLFTVFFTTVKTLPWTARSKECYWLVGVFENRVVKKNTFKAPESCSRHTDSLKWCKVEKARKNREGTEESAYYLNAWNTPKTPLPHHCLRITFNGPHKLPIETGYTFLWRVYCLVRIRPWRARQPCLGSCLFLLSVFGAFFLFLGAC